MEAGRTQPDSGGSQSGGLGAAVRVTALVTLASRFGGLARDMLVGLMFRDTALGSAFAFAFALPNLFRRLFGEGALSAAFIPEYTRAQQSDPESAGRLASLTLRWLGLVAGAIAVVGELVLLVLLVVLPADPERRTAILLLMTMLPFMPLICAAAIMAGMLQVHGRFGPASAGPLVLNAFIIVVGLYFVLTRQAAGEWAAYCIGIATTLSGVTQVCWFAKLLKPSVKWTRDTAAAEATGRVMMKKFVPVMIGAGTLQLNTFLDNLIATYTIWVGPMILGVAYPLDDRSGSVLALTARLYQFPLGVFGLAVATAVFPMLARHADNAGEFAKTLTRGVRLSLFISLPASVGLILVREDATAALAPTFSDEGKARCAAVLLGFAPGVWAYAINHVLTRTFYARGDMRTPMRIAIAMVGVNLALNVSLIWWLREAGLAWATSSAAILQTLVLAMGLRKRGLGAGAMDPAAWTAIGRMVIMCALMGAAVVGVRWAWPSGVGEGWWAIVWRLLGCVSAGGIVYVALSVLLKCPEPKWLLHREKRSAGGEALGGEL